jgi:high-affinity iron transporter
MALTPLKEHRIQSILILILISEPKIVLASLLIVFREVLEAGLIVGIILAATDGIPARGRWIAAGVGAGVLGAMVVAVSTGAIGETLEGMGQEAFTVGVLLVAVIMLGWHVVWMARHGREMRSQMVALGGDVKGGDKSLAALAVVVALAVLREGSEVVLFLYGIVQSTQEGPLALITGGILGLALGAATSFALYRGLLTIPARRFFAVTNGLVMLLAAGMAGQAASLLASVDLLPTFGARLWDSSSALSDSSLAGRALHALVGYSAQPSGVQVAAYCLTLLTLIVLSRLVGSDISRPFSTQAGQ